jgi:recombination protein RecA
MGNLQLILNEINKKYGEGTIRPANEFPHLKRISTGVFSLDVEIGGGLPKGRIVIFTGNESTGKTTVAKLSVAQFQKTCKNCLNAEELCSCETFEPHKAVFVDMEGAFDANWFADLGGNIDELLLIQPEFAEQAIDIVEALVGSGEVDIIVIDSIAMMSPADEVEKSSEQLLVGTHARLMNRMMRSIQSRMNSLGMTNERKPTVILINQIRKNVGVMYGSPDTYPGGLGQKFASSITVKFSSRPSERIHEDSGGKKKEEAPVGITVRFNVEKNKTFLPMRSGLFVLYVAGSSLASKGSINTEEQIVDYGVRYGIIEKSGAWFSVKEDIEGLELQYQGKQSLCNALIINKNAINILTEKILNKVLEETSVKIKEGEV